MMISTAFLLNRLALYSPWPSCVTVSLSRRSYPKNFLVLSLAILHQYFRTYVMDTYCM